MSRVIIDGNLVGVVMKWRLWLGIPELECRIQDNQIMGLRQHPCLRILMLIPGNMGNRTSSSSSPVGALNASFTGYTTLYRSSSLCTRRRGIDWRNGEESFRGIRQTKVNKTLYPYTDYYRNSPVQNQLCNEMCYASSEHAALYTGPVNIWLSGPTGRLGWTLRHVSRQEPVVCPDIWPTPTEAYRIRPLPGHGGLVLCSVSRTFRIDHLIGPSGLSLTQTTSLSKTVRLTKPSHNPPWSSTKKENMHDGVVESYKRNTQPSPEYNTEGGESR
ncbi:hypothetical protein V8F20_006542 [Naviculisporaceae sp. PSN 640]